MSEIRDNPNSEDYLFDSGSIKLTESEPLSSNSYIYIDLETDESSRRAARARQQQAARGMSQAEAEQLRQKKAKRKGAEAQAKQAAAPRRGAEPALHVIIEHESPYDDFDFEPEIPDPAPAMQDSSMPGMPDVGMLSSIPGIIPDASQQYAAGSWQAQQPMQAVQPIQQAQPMQQAYAAQQLQPQVQPVAPGYPMQPAQQAAQPAPSAHSAQQIPSAQGAQQAQPHSFVQQYMQETPSVQPQTYQPLQQMQPMQPMQPMGSAVIGGFIQPEVRLQNSQQADAGAQIRASHVSPTVEVGIEKPADMSDSVQMPTESVSADGKVVRRPWGSPSPGAAKPGASAGADMRVNQASASGAAPSVISMQDAYSANIDRGHAHRGMMSWKKNMPDAKDINHAFGSATVPITMQNDAYQPVDRPEVYIAPQQNDAFAAVESPIQEQRPIQAEKPKPKEKPLKINVGTHGRVSTQDHLTISRESIEKLSREQEAKASPIKTMSSRGASGASQGARPDSRPQRAIDPDAGKVKNQPLSSGKPKSKPADASGYIDSFGAPLLDEAAIEESSMFEEPPTSIADGMKAADKHHKKHRKGIVAAVIFIIAVAIAAVLAVLNFTGQINIASMLNGILPQQSSTQQGTATGSSSSAAASSSAKTNQSGTVIYEYTATTSGGVDYKVKETVTFSADGDCESTQMEYEFPNEADLEALLANLSRDYGSDYQLISQNGNKATVVIDISNLKLDREAYEDALRYSVDDLMILKK